MRENCFIPIPLIMTKKYLFIKVNTNYFSTDHQRNVQKEQDQICQDMTEREQDKSIHYIKS